MSEPAHTAPALSQVELDDFTAKPGASNGAGLVGKGWVGDATSPGTSEPGTGLSLIGQIGFPLRRSRA